MENQKYIDKAIQELQKINFDDIPKVVRQAVLISNIKLKNASTLLEDYKMNKENEKC